MKGIVEIDSQVFERDFEEYLAEAEQRPVVISRPRAPASVLLAVGEYARLLRLSRRVLAEEIDSIDTALVVLDKADFAGLRGADWIGQSDGAGNRPVGVLISADLLAEAADLGVDIQAAAVAGIEAAIQLAKGRPHETLGA